MGIRKGDFVLAPIERVWLEQYPEGVPPEVDYGRHHSLPELFEHSCERFGDLPAYTSMGRTLSYAELRDEVHRFAAFLQQDLGLEKGDRVAIMLPNTLQYPVALFGALTAGCTVVNTNPLYTARELKHQLADSGATTIVVLENFAQTLERTLQDTEVKTVVVTGMGDMLGGIKGTLVNFVLRYVKRMVPSWNIPGAIRFREALQRGAGRSIDPPDLDHDDLAFLQYTGGTTGVAKGAMLTHANMLANIEQSAVWLTQTMKDGEETVITALPLYHIFALTANCLVFLKIGGLNVLIPNPRDMKAFIKTLEGTRFSGITGVNTLFNGLLNAPGFSELDFSALKLSLGGGMAVQRAVAERWKQTTGCTLLEAWGLTETSPAVCINPPDLPDYNGSIGLPIPSTEVSAQDDEGNILPAGEVGELCVRGPQVMKGYWKRPEETARSLSDDGWLRTGDMGKMDEQGYFYIVDRKKDMINVSGFNVYPNEIEDVLAMHPGILEAGVVGVSDDRSGETVKAVVVRKDESLTREQVIEHCRENLTGYKIPHIVEFRDELPKTNVGKILRKELR
jgi:long-chain acyl-CoA synthetase